LDFNRHSLVEIGQFYRETVQASKSLELKATVRRMTDLEIGMFAIFVIHVGRVVLENCNRNDGEQMALFN
jgi:hypothetical protein